MNDNEYYKLSDIGYQCLEREVKEAKPKLRAFNLHEVFALWDKNHICYVVKKCNKVVLIVRISEMPDCYYFDTVWIRHFEKQEREEIMREVEFYLRNSECQNSSKPIWWWGC